MKKIKLIAILLLASCACFAQRLPRMGFLGTRIETVTEENYKSFSLPEPRGVRILEVITGTSKALGLMPDDIVMKINDVTMINHGQMVSYMASTREGDDITVEIMRKGKIKKLKGSVIGKPREFNPNAEIIYESVAFKNGRLSVIINKPHVEGKLPAVLFIPGYTCSSVDNLPESNPYGRIVRAYSDAGYVVVRVEKSGLGDSQNTIDCSETDLIDEIESFTAGLLKLKSLPYVDTNSVFIWGHSMGGVIAPAIAAKHKVKGTIVYGTTSKSFFEYQLELNRLQEMLSKPDPLEYEKECRLSAQISYEYYIEKKKLEDIASTPEKLKILQTDWGYNGKDKIHDRNQEYWRQIVDYPLMESWKNTTGDVLVLYGGADFQAFSLPDHEQIVYTVNYYQPGKAKLVVFPDTDHYMAKSGSRQNSYDTFLSGNVQHLFDSFNFEVINKSIEWTNNLAGKAVVN